MAMLAGACVGAESGPIVGGDWPGYNRSLNGDRYSPLHQINASNVSGLQEICHLRVDDRGSFQSSLIVVNGTMYFTAAADTIAMDPVTCALKWRHHYVPSDQSVAPMNRGVAYSNGRLFRGTGDARLLALDAETGKLLWSDVIGDSERGEFIPGAPVTWNGLVITGTAASEFGNRGRVAAYDALNGREIWRFDTIPVGDATGADTWKGKWSAHGGGGTWSTFTIDPASAEIFIPVGNPVPDFAPTERPGSNLFTNSVLVLDARTGKLQWWYQLEASDPFDHDLAAAPLLYHNSESLDMVAAAGKDGYLRIIDRATHRLLYKTAVTTVDAHPHVPTATGVRVCPGAAGGVEWNGPAFDPQLRTLFVGAVDYCSMETLTPATRWSRGGMNFGGSWAPTNEPSTGWITAVDSDTGQLRWRYHAEAPVLAGVTATAGGLILTGDNDGNFLVFRGADGTVLKKLQTGGSLSGGVITYEIEGKQYIAFTSGNLSLSLFGAIGRPTVIVLGLDPAASAAARSGAPDPDRGAYLYGMYCAGCHGPDGKHVTGFDLSTVHSRRSTDELIAWLKNPAPPMPKMFPEPLNPNDEEDVRAITDFLMHLH